MTSDLKILSVRFIRPTELKGVGMVDHLHLGQDPETKQPFNPHVSATWIAEAGAMRIVTARGETWVPSANIASLQPLFEPPPAPGRKTK